VQQAPEAAAPELTGRGLVLVVDDDEYVLKSVRLTLESYGYSAIVAESGEKAIEIYRQRQTEIDLVVLDLMMPGMDGGETFEVLRSIRPDVQVLLSTGYDTTEATRRVATDALAGVLRKPYLPEQLVAEVKRLLGNDRRAQPSGEFESQFADLRASYRSKLPKLLSGLASAVRAARAADASEPARREAWQLAHRIKGTAGSYGIEELAEPLAAIDALLEGLIERSEAGETEWLEIEKALARALASFGAS
jgi:CheY-like chemotaxis protein/HPt (histidine-containing phosphotransfer) domain-containing protein